MAQSCDPFATRYSATLLLFVTEINQSRELIISNYNIRSANDRAFDIFRYFSREILRHICKTSRRYLPYSTFLNDKVSCAYDMSARHNKEWGGISLQWKVERVGEEWGGRVGETGPACRERRKDLNITILSTYSCAKKDVLHICVLLSASPEVFFFRHTLRFSRKISFPYKSRKAATCRDYFYLICRRN